MAVEPCCWDSTGSAARLGTSLATSSRKLSSGGSAGFLSRFESEVASLARAALARVRRLTPPAYELVYDAYNALAIGFSSSERSGEHFLHVAVYPRHVNIGFPFGSSQITGCSEAVRGFDTFRFRVRAVEGDALAVLTREAVPHALVSVETAPPARRKLLVKAV